MQTLRKMQALLGASTILSALVLGSLALGSAASEQMAAKRHISMQFRENMLKCEHLRGAAEQACERQAHGWAEVAKAELESQRRGARQARQAQEDRMPAQLKVAQARCNALPGRVRGRCADGAARRG